jgi:glycosyltransferase involved in cell wall biosynthesis
MPGRSASDGRRRAFIMGPSWPPGRPPSRLARVLGDEGWDVTVYKRPALDERVGRLRLAAWLLAAAWRAPRTLLSAFRATGHVSGLRARLWWLYRSLPALRRSCDAVFVAARAEAEPYAVLGATRRLVAVAESPLPHPNRPEERLDRLLESAAEVWCETETARVAAKAHGARDVILRSPAVAGAARPNGSVEHGRLVCTTPLDWAGGQTYALSALRQLLDRGVDVRLALSGEGPDRERILFTVADLELGSRVELGGAALEHAEVFVLPVVYDGAWPEAREARAAGVPVVASRLPGLADLDAVVVPPRDAGALADALGRLLLER